MPGTAGQRQKANSPTDETGDLAADVAQAERAPATLQRGCLNAVKSQTSDQATQDQQDAALQTLIQTATTPESGLAQLRMVEPELGPP